MRAPSARTAGLAGVAALVALALVVLALSVVPFGAKTYTAELEHTAGLRTGEEVQVAGVGVGEVEKIHLRGRHVEVEFTVDRDVRLGRSTSVAVKVATLLGTHFLEVSPRGDGHLADDTVPLARTSVPYNLQDVVEGTQATLGGLDSERLGQSLDVVAGVLGKSSKQARRAISGVADLADVASRRSDQLARLLKASRQVTGTLNKNRTQIRDLLKQSTLVLAELTKRRDAIEAMLRDSRRLAVTVKKLLDDTSDDLDPLMVSLEKSLDGLEDAKDDVVGALHGLATMSRYVANASGNGPWLDLNVPEALGDNAVCVVSRSCRE